MGNNTSPLESLAAFAIAFAVGVLSTASLGVYISKLKKQAKPEPTTDGKLAT